MKNKILAIVLSIMCVSSAAYCNLSEIKNDLHQLSKGIASLNEDNASIQRVLVKIGIRHVESKIKEQIRKCEEKLSSLKEEMHILPVPEEMEYFQEKTFNTEHRIAKLKTKLKEYKELLEDIQDLKTALLEM